MKLSKGERIFQGINCFMLTFFGILTLYPFWDVIRISLCDAAEASRMVFSIWPEKPTFYSYGRVLSNSFTWLGYENTALRVVLGVSIQLLLMVLFSYPISKKNIPHRNGITLFAVFTMFFSGGLIPEYLLIRNLGLYDTIWSLVLPAAIPTFSMLIMRNYFMSLPVELEESAKIDGASEIRILAVIVLPVSMPIIATVALWGVVGHWNAWFDCLIYIKDPKKIVLQAVLRKIIYEAAPAYSATDTSESVTNMTSETVKAAAIIVATAPVMCLYPFLQKYFIKGILVGSLKG